MEILPVEMLEMIVRQLTPQDVARCSAVCRKWHEMFNQDWMWKPLCDPELEEPLQTIPCVATPAFVTPEAENSTLTSVSHWKLAFMRETRLWESWRRKDYINKKESTIKCENQYPRKVEFLTDTLVVAQYSNHIEILDVSVMPSAFVARTHIRAESFCVIRPNMFLVEKVCSMKVFNMDILNKSIKLMHTISLNSPRRPRAVKEHLYICVNSERTKLIVFDLYTGKLLKEEPFPLIMNQNGNIEVWSITTSPSSDFVAVDFEVATNDGNKYSGYHVYSLKQRAFLPGPVAGPPPVDARLPTIAARLAPLAARLSKLCGSDVAMHNHWMVVNDFGTLKVYNLLSQEVCELDLDCYSISECNNGFVLSVYEGERKLLKSYSPVHKTLNTICKMSQHTQFKVMNSKIILTFDYPRKVSKRVWNTSGQILECGASVCFDSKINRSFTKVLSRGCLERSGKGPWNVTYFW